jgi:large subunit ribosomal protein L25
MGDHQGETESKMAKPEIVLNVDVRERTGRGGARDVRRQDRVPGILYGGDREPVAISIDKKTVNQALKSGKFISHTVTLEHKGERQLVFTQDIQFHPVTDEPTHLDLFRVEKGQMIRVAVHVRFIGQGVSPGIKRGGALNIVRHEVWLVAPADEIPEELVADVSELDIGGAVKISAIKLPANTRPTIVGRDFTVATIAGRSAKDEVIDEKPAAAATAEGAVPVEGAEGAAPAAGAPAAPGAAPAAGAKGAPAAGGKAPAGDKKK